MARPAIVRGCVAALIVTIPSGQRTLKFGWVEQQARIAGIISLIVTISSGQGTLEIGLVELQVRIATVGVL